MRCFACGRVFVKRRLSPPRRSALSWSPAAMQILVEAAMSAAASMSVEYGGVKRHSGLAAAQPVSMQIATFSFHASIQQGVCVFKAGEFMHD